MGFHSSKIFWSAYLGSLDPMPWTYEELNLTPRDLLIRRNDRRTWMWGLLKMFFVRNKEGESLCICISLDPRHQPILGAKGPWPKGRGQWWCWGAKTVSEPWFNVSSGKLRSSALMPNAEKSGVANFTLHEISQSFKLSPYFLGLAPQPLCGEWELWPGRYVLQAP